MRPDFSKIDYKRAVEPSDAHESDEWLSPEHIAVKSFYTPESDLTPGHRDDGRVVIPDLPPAGGQAGLRRMHAFACALLRIEDNKQAELPVPLLVGSCEIAGGQQSLQDPRAQCLVGDGPPARQLRVDVSQRLSQIVGPAPFAEARGQQGYGQEQHRQEELPGDSFHVKSVQNEMQALR